MLDSFNLLSLDVNIALYKDSVHIGLIQRMTCRVILQYCTYPRGAPGRVATACLRSLARTHLHSHSPPASAARLALSDWPSADANGAADAVTWRTNSEQLICMRPYFFSSHWPLTHGSSISSSQGRHLGLRKDLPVSHLHQ